MCYNRCHTGSVYMKKRTALTLSVIALLGTGVTFGVKSKQKKDFEKILKTVLVPEAEEKLDKLLREDASLQDSIDFYQALLLQQESEVDGQRKAEKYQKSLGIPTTTMYSRLNKVSNTLELIEGDWAKAYAAVREQEASFYIGDGEYENLPDELVKRKAYLRKMTNTLIGDNIDNIPDIPGGYQQHYARGYNDVKFDFFDSRRFDEYTEYLRCEIKAASVGKYTTTGSQGNRVFYPIVSAADVKQLLIAIKYFVNNFDNSHGIVQQRHILQINKQIDELLPVVEGQITLEQTRDNTALKLNSFKIGKKKTEEQIRKQEKNLEVLKTTDVKKLMKNQKLRS